MYEITVYFAHDNRAKKVTKVTLETPRIIGDDAAVTHAVTVLKAADVIPDDDTPWYEVFCGVKVGKARLMKGGK